MLYAKIEVCRKRKHQRRTSSSHREGGGSTEGTNTLPEDEGERTEETSSSRTEVLEISQGIYASEASRPMTLEEMFEQQREEERNTPEFLATAEESYQERKRWWIEHCRLKGTGNGTRNVTTK